MSKRTFMAAIVLIVLIVSTVAVMLAVNLTRANPVPLIPPTSPTTEPPQIVIQSPLSATYESPNVLLNFTVTGCRHGLTSPSPNIKDYHLDYVDYGIDGKEVYLNFSNVLDNQSFSEVLTGLADENHAVTVNVVAVSTYATNIISLGNNTYRYTENYYYPQSSQTIDFTVDENLTAQIPNSVVTPPAPDFNLTFVGQPHNGTIVLTIKNQPINNPVNGEYYYYYYNVRDKGHNVSDEYWNHYYSGPNTAVQLALPMASGSQYTTLTYSADDYQSNYQIDYQVQIIVATDVHVFSDMNFSDGQWEKEIIGQSDAGEPGLLEELLSGQ